MIRDMEDDTYLLVVLVAQAREHERQQRLVREAQRGAAARARAAAAAATHAALAARAAARRPAHITHIYIYFRGDSSLVTGASRAKVLRTPLDSKVYTVCLYLFPPRFCTCKSNGAFNGSAPLSIKPDFSLDTLRNIIYWWTGRQNN